MYSSFFKKNKPVNINLRASLFLVGIGSCSLLSLNYLREVKLPF